MKSVSGFLAGFLGGLVTLTAFLLAANCIGKIPGALSIGGPTLGFLIIICIIVASIPASIAVAIFAFRSSRRHYEEKNRIAHAKNQNANSVTSN